MAKKISKVTFESNPFKVIFRGFDNLFKYNQTLAIILLVFSALGAFGQFFNFGLDGMDGSSTASPQLATSTVVIIVIVATVIGLVLLIGAFFLGTIINGFVAYVAYKTSREETTTFSEAIKVVVAKFWTILWIQVLVFFRVLGGLVLLIIPGIRALLRYDMVLFPVFDENANAKQAIIRSKAITKNHLIEIFGMNVAASLIPLVGQLFQVGGRSVMYPQLKQLQASGATRPKVHWLNYLALLLVVGLLLLVFVGVGLILMLVN